MSRLSDVAAGFALGAAFTTVVLAGTATSTEEPRQPDRQSQAGVRIVLDNARVRVRDVTFPPGATGMHTHDLAHVGIVIQGGTLVFKYPDGTSETAKLETGSVGFREANVTHEPVNPGSSAVRVIEVELKP